MKKKKSQGKAEEVTVNSKEENSLDFCLDLFQEFGLCRTMLKSECGKRIEQRWDRPCWFDSKLIKKKAYVAVHTR